MKSNVSGILLWDCRISKRLLTVTRYHLSCSGHPTYRLLRVPLLRSHSYRVHYKWQQHHLMNPYNSPQMSTFPLITCTIPSVLSKSCHEFYQPRKMKQPNFTTTIKHNMHRRQQKIFKCISECTFRTTQLVAMHNTVMTRNTNGVPPSETHKTTITSSSADQLTFPQFKYWGKSVSDDMTTYMVLYCLKYKAQT